MDTVRIKKNMSYSSIVLFDLESSNPFTQTKDNGFIFPALAKTFDFYKAFESIFFLKPVSDKGVYGWLYRVYPEPWQVVLQTPYTGKDGRLSIQDSVALVSDTRPSYQECVQALLKEASLLKQD